MELDKIKHVVELSSTQELDRYLELGWVVTLCYVEECPTGDAGCVSRTPKYHVAWTRDDAPQYPSQEEPTGWD